jgi:hypothetical protein
LGESGLVVMVKGYPNSGAKSSFGYVKRFTPIMGIPKVGDQKNSTGLRSSNNIFVAIF